MRKQTFLTGATGFVGSNVALQLLREGHQLILLARGNNRESACQRVEKVFGTFDSDFHRYKSQWEIVEGDLTENAFGISPETLKGDIDEIWHCAAITDFRGNPELMFEVNVEGTRKILELAEEIGVSRLHYVSTAYICGTREGRILEEELNCGQGFHNLYEETKYQAECLVEKWSNTQKFGVTIYRPSIIVGDAQGKALAFEGFYSLVRAFWSLKQMVLGGIKKEPRRYSDAGIYLNDNLLHLPIRVLCNPQSLINLVTVDFFTEMVMTLSKTDESIGKTFHIVNPNPPTFEPLFFTGTRILEIEGLRLLKTAQIDLSEFLRGAFNGIKGALETKLYHLTREYFPYISCNVEFDYSNVREILGEVIHPVFSEERVRKLTEYAIASKFKRPI